jgi:adhesin/invasin
VGAGAADKVFEVNSLELLTEDAVAGDGTCATSTPGQTPQCTLRAALEEANAWGKSHPGDRILVSVAPGFAGGTISLDTLKSKDQGMLPAQAVGKGTDVAIVYAVTTAMTIDLAGRIDFGGAGAAFSAIVFYLQADDIVLRNFGNVVSSEVGIAVDSGASNVLIERGTLIQTTSGVMRRAIEVVGGARNVTVRDVVISRVWGGTLAGGVAVSPGPGGAAVEGLTIRQVVFDSTWLPGVDECTKDAGGGCNGPGLSISSNVPVNGLTVSRCVFKGFVSWKNGGNSRLMSHPFYGKSTGTLTDVRIVDNDFLDNYLYGFVNAAALTLENVPFAGTTTIARNTFDNSASSGTHEGGAIFVDQASSSTGTVTIEDNYFNMEFKTRPGATTTVQAVVLHKAGTTTIRHNTFGPLSRSQNQGLAESEETWAAEKALLVANSTSKANRQIRPWYPTSAVASPDTCEATLTVNPPSAGTHPTLPAELDVYYTPAWGAEVYLGTQTVTSEAETPITVPYFQGSAGNVRVQTHGSTGKAGVVESSQFSRVTPIGQAAPGCAPGITIVRGDGQAEETMRRTVSFLVTSDAPITAVGPTEAGVGPDQIDLSESTAPGVRVVDVARLNRRQVIVTVRADDTGMIIAALTAMVTAADGTSLAPSAHDNWVSYTNPLGLTPSELSVPDAPVVSASYKVTSQLAPTEDVVISQTVDGDVLLVSGESMTLDAAGEATAWLIAIPDDVPAGDREARITHVVSSADPDFDGLYLPDVLVAIIDGDRPPPAPGIQIVKRGWIWLGQGDATYEGLVTPGLARPLPSGSAIVAGSEVWWTYEVTNVGETPLTNVAVRDNALDTPEDGLVCEVDSLDIEETHGCAASGLVVDQTST